MKTWCETCSNLGRAACPASVTRQCLYDDRRYGLEQLHECCDYKKKKGSEQLELGIEEKQEDGILHYQ